MKPSDKQILEILGEVGKLVVPDYIVTTEKIAAFYNQAFQEGARAMRDRVKDEYLSWSDGAEYHDADEKIDQAYSDVCKGDS